MYEDTLRNNVAKEIFCYADLERIYEILGEYTTEEYIAKRVDKSIQTHTIAPLSDCYKKRIPKNKAELRHCYFVPKEQLPIPGEIRIYRNII